MFLSRDSLACFGLGQCGFQDGTFAIGLFLGILTGWFPGLSSQIGQFRCGLGNLSILVLTLFPGASALASLIALPCRVGLSL